MSPRNSVQRAFDAFGKNHFREKRSGVWLRSSAGVQQSLDLQKSQYNLRYYLNVSIVFDDAVPDELAGHEDDQGITKRIEGRVESLLPSSSGEELRHLLDIDDFPLTEELREHRLLTLLETAVAPMLGTMNTLAGIHDAYVHGRVRGRVLITRSARRVLDAL